MKTSKSTHGGFTLVEVLIVIFIFTTLLALPTIFLWGIGRANVLKASTREVVGALHEVQTNAISGQSVDGQQPSSYGIHLEANYYEIFRGTSYNPNDSTNQRNDLPSGITFSQIQLPNKNVIFDNVTGHVRGFDQNQNFIVLLEGNSQEQKKITVSSIGGINYE